MVWDSDPLSVGATPVQVWIDGAPQFKDPVELEKPASAGGGGWKVTNVRRKDRMTYTHQAVQIDLTQVGIVDLRTGEGDKVHELEVECCNMADWSRQAVADVDGRQNRFDDLVGQFCSTVNKLNQVAAEAGQQ